TAPSATSRDTAPPTAVPGRGGESGAAGHEVAPHALLEAAGLDAAAQEVWRELVGGAAALREVFGATFFHPPGGDTPPIVIFRDYASGLRAMATRHAPVRAALERRLHECYPELSEQAAGHVVYLVYDQVVAARQGDGGCLTPLVPRHAGPGAQS
ncbi:MAG: hypothetical protein M3Q65_24175, partial [Chloroflexota bacterium]|nr:hypothetical protein [Chloroflexota bacterium]